jgi:hypothetical protein|tara:strand:+ start:386 stop:673 length:288 start_codon:yes stop_codon:yes gene_type:complete
MNRKKSKRIKNHSESLLVLWMKGLLPEDEAEKVNLKTYKSMMPVQTHFMAQRTMYLNAYHPKWVAKKIKQLLKIFPAIQIEDINLEMIAWKVKQQ